MGDNWERNDLKKYTKETKAIGFRIDADYEGKGNEAKHDLITVFKALVFELKRFHPDDYKRILEPYDEGIKKVNQILTLDIMRD